MKKGEKVHTVIWDWNGTLLEDTWLCVEIINDVLVRRDLPQVTLEQHRDLFEFPVIDYYRRLGFDMEKESFEVLGDEFMWVYEERKLECQLYDGIPEVMQSLRKASIRQSLLSAYHHDYLVNILQHFQLQNSFDHVLGAEDHYAEGKKSQAAVLLDRLGIAPQQALLIGDTLHDFEVAESIGAQCRLVTTGNHPRSKLEHTGAQVYDSAGDALADLF